MRCVLGKGLRANLLRVSARHSRSPPLSHPSDLSTLARRSCAARSPPLPSPEASLAPPRPPREPSAPPGLARRGESARCAQARSFSPPPVPLPRDCPAPRARDCVCVCVHSARVLLRRADGQRAPCSPERARVAWDGRALLAHAGFCVTGCCSRLHVRHLEDTASMRVSRFHAWHREPTH